MFEARCKWNILIGGLWAYQYILWQYIQTLQVLFCLRNKRLERNCIIVLITKLISWKKKGIATSRRGRGEDFDPF